MKILVTGFEPFGGEDVNPSWEAVKAVQAPAGIQLEKILLPVSFRKAPALIEEKIQSLRPDVILSLGQIFRSDFGLFYQVPMNQGSLYSVTQTIDTYVYRALLKTNDVGMSSAASFVQSVVGFIFIVGANKVVSHLDENSKLF